MKQEEFEKAKEKNNFVEIRTLEESDPIAKTKLASQLDEATKMIDFDVLSYIHPEDRQELKGRQVIPVIMITVEKVDGNGNFVKFKTRLVVRGDKQYLEDWVETNAPVVSTATLFASLCIAVKEDLQVDIIDVMSAFLHAEMPKENPVYVWLGSEIADLLVQIQPHLEQYRNDKGGMVCMLRKALYGLKEAPFLWYKEISSILEELGFKCSSWDRGLFIRVKGKDIHRLSLHVDDMVSGNGGNEEGTQCSS